MKSFKNRNIASQVKQLGFTLVEMSVVLVVIGLIVGAVSIGSDLQRNAVYQQISSNFMQSWSQAYQNYFNKTGIVIGDSASAPTLKVDGANATPGEICTTSLQGFMDAAGIRMPAGRSEGNEDKFVYLDSNGNPQETTVCFQNVNWSLPGATSGYVVRKRNVMVLKSLTPDLARFLDSQVDGKVDARFGLFRESTLASNTGTASTDWSIDNRRAYGTTSNTNQDESQVAVVTAYFMMNN
ncbi:prepilin-type N-terminal cleavage/methylation domain-containing protein [Thiomicrorhabdus immobilis]|uniref:Prepilin-type N-terminal cleavage/methylation domain-containing protein n=1 Tax=Thiomicrorhabdus immobilis TaxID=2791037 RepID=A0ABM7MFN5_9GAMM|nr:prepilin-type N-terminal cleavage/methylation domain-containing protein [Thiomicrorhabdus immobilis]BCN94302.1 prepilin-type N-terminal cleavage/methylation domain-containing protein [Thiomicrorhabdus immobilis]